MNTKKAVLIIGIAILIFVVVCAGVGTVFYYEGVIRQTEISAYYLGSYNACVIIMANYTDIVAGDVESFSTLIKEKCIVFTEENVSLNFNNE